MKEINANLFEVCDAFIILTRQGLVLVSMDASLTFQEDNYLCELNKKLVERTEQLIEECREEQKNE